MNRVFTRNLRSRFNFRKHGHFILSGRGSKIYSFSMSKPWVWIVVSCDSTTLPALYNTDLKMDRNLKGSWSDCDPTRDIVRIMTRFELCMTHWGQKQYGQMLKSGIEPSPNGPLSLVLQKNLINELSSLYVAMLLKLLKSITPVVLPQYMFSGCM